MKERTEKQRDVPEKEGETEKSKGWAQKELGNRSSKHRRS